MRTKYKKLHLITYDLGDAFDPLKFKPVKNRNHIKPEGGLWASPIGSRWGWLDWCKSEQFRPLESSFRYFYHGNIFTIDSRADAMEMPWISPYPDLPSLSYPDYEAMARMGVDAIHMTIHGERETRLTSDYSLYGWDCESVLIFNPSGITLDKRR